MKPNTTLLAVELQHDESISIKKNRPFVGYYNCVGAQGLNKGTQNMNAFEIFRDFTQVESQEFFNLVLNKSKINNHVVAEYLNSYSQSELKRFRKAIKQLIAKDCVRVVNKTKKIYMVNPKLCLGYFEAYESMVNEYERL